MNRNISFDENPSQKNNHRKRKILIQFVNLNSLSLNKHLGIWKSTFYEKLQNLNRDGEKEIHKMKDD